jgi:hypothetical protein
MVFTNKIDMNGKIKERKARMVVRGFLQTYGIDYLETFSPVIGTPTLRLVLATAAILGANLDVIDCT